jgi:hypothetical protein
MTDHTNKSDDKTEDPHFVDSEKSRNIMDGASGEVFEVIREVDDLRKIAGCDWRRMKILSIPKSVTPPLFGHEILRGK